MMDVLKRAIHRLRSYFPSPPLDRELEAEMATHLELAIEENLRKGMPAEEARRLALIRFGGVEQAKERHREARGIPELDILLQDLRHSFRSLRRDRTFAFVALLILALGIGANIVVFSVVNTILLRPLPFCDSQRLVRIVSKDSKGGESTMTYSVDATQELREQNRSFQEVTGYYAFSASDNYKLTGYGDPVPVTGILVAGNFFQTLGVEPALGRLFTDEETLKNSRPAVLLSHTFWQRHFNGDAAIIGRAINLNRTPVVVVGVLPDTFDFASVFAPGTKVDIYTPFISDDHRDDGNDLALMARLKPGVTLPQAQAEADLLFPQLHFNLRHPEWRGGYTANILGLKDYVSGKLRRSLIVLCALSVSSCSSCA